MRWRFALLPFLSFVFNYVLLISRGAVNSSGKIQYSETQMTQSQHPPWLLSIIVFDLEQLKKVAIYKLTSTKIKKRRKALLPSVLAPGELRSFK